MSRNIKVLFFLNLHQQLPREIHLNLKEKSVAAEETGNLLKKVAIEKVHMKKVSAKSQFVRNLFLEKKKDGNNRPLINLKNRNQYIPPNISKWKTNNDLGISSNSVRSSLVMLTYEKSVTAER